MSKIETRQARTTYSLDQNRRVVITTEWEAKDIDTDTWVVGGRQVINTGIRKEDLVAALEANRDAATAEHQAEIDKVRAIVEPVKATAEPKKIVQP